MYIIGIYEWPLQKKSRFDKPQSDQVDDFFSRAFLVGLAGMEERNPRNE
jgi:hypothetical protein